MGHLERKQLKSSIRLGTLWLAEQGEGKTGVVDLEDDDPGIIRSLPTSSNATIRRFTNQS